MSEQRARRTRRVGIVGTFDVANFGDLLFPYLAEDALRRRLEPIDLRRYSIRPMAAPGPGRTSSTRSTTCSGTSTSWTC